MTLTNLFTSIANAIRSKTGETATIKAENFPEAIEAIPTGSDPVVSPLSVTENGTYTASEGVDGYSPINVNVTSGLAYDMGEFVLDADTVYANAVPHDLGSTPEFVLVWTDDLTGLTNEDTQNDISVGFVWLKNLTGLQQILSGTRRCDGLSVNFTQRSEEDALFVVKPSYVDYCPDASLFTDATFALHMLSISSSWRAGITYKYFISKAWWNTELGGDTNA